MAAAIEQVMVAVAKNILEGEGFGYSLPSRGQNDQVYLEQLDRIVLKDKATFTSFSSTGSVRKVAILTRVMQLVHGVLARGGEGAPDEGHEGGGKGRVEGLGGGMGGNVSVRVHICVPLSYSTFNS